MTNDNSISESIRSHKPSSYRAPMSRRQIEKHYPGPMTSDKTEQLAQPNLDRESPALVSMHVIDVLAGRVVDESVLIARARQEHNRAREARICAHERRVAEALRQEETPASACSPVPSAPTANTNGQRPRTTGQPRPRSTPRRPRRKWKRPSGKRWQDVPPEPRPPVQPSSTRDG
jgi:hypothetical protein